MKNTVKKRFLIRLMHLLGFGGMAAYCAVGCASQNQKADLDQKQEVSDAQPLLSADSANAAASDKPASEVSDAQPSQSADSANAAASDKPASEVAAASQAADSQIDGLPKDELDKIINKYAELPSFINYKIVERTNDYTVVKMGDSSGEVTIKFPSSFVTLRHHTNYYVAVFSDGKTGRIYQDSIERPDPDCKMRYACPTLGFETKKYKYNKENDQLEYDTSM